MDQKRLSLGVAEYSQQSHCPVTVVPRDQQPMIEEEVAKLQLKGGIIPVDGQRAGFCSMDVPGPQERVWAKEASGELEAPHPVYPKGAVQHGGFTGGTRSPARGGTECISRTHTLRFLFTGSTNPFRASSGDQRCISSLGSRLALHQHH